MPQDGSTLRTNEAVAKSRLVISSTSDFGCSNLHRWIRPLLRTRSCSSSRLMQPRGVSNGPLRADTRGRFSSLSVIADCHLPAGHELSVRTLISFCDCPHRLALGVAASLADAWWIPDSSVARSIQPSLHPPTDAHAGRCVGLHPAPTETTDRSFARPSLADAVSATAIVVSARVLVSATNATANPVANPLIV